MKLSLLDVSQRIDHALELAPLVERLGYTRYWIAEHPPQPSPILMAAIVAGQTTHLRVGTAGVLLHYHPPLRTSHDFRFLERVFPNRIDAGFCGGRGSAVAVEEADREGRDLDALIAAYPERAEQFVRYLRDPHDTPTAWPFGDDVPPQIWSLGSGPRSAELAARLGLSFGYSLLFGSPDDPATLRRYRESFVPHPDLAAPVAVVAVCGMCAATDAEAEAQVRPLNLDAFMPKVIGSPQTCAARLAELAHRYEVDEIVFADLYNDIEARVQCHELLAAAVL